MSYRVAILTNEVSQLRRSAGYLRQINTMFPCQRKIPALIPSLWMNNCECIVVMEFQPTDLLQLTGLFSQSKCQKPLIGLQCNSSLVQYSSWRIFTLNSHRVRIRSPTEKVLHSASEKPPSVFQSCELDGYEDGNIGWKDFSVTHSHRSKHSTYWGFQCMWTRFTRDSPMKRLRVARGQWPIRTFISNWNGSFRSESKCLCIFNCKHCYIFRILNKSIYLFRKMKSIRCNGIQRKVICWSDLLLTLCVCVYVCISLFRWTSAVFSWAIAIRS